MNDFLIGRGMVAKIKSEFELQVMQLMSEVMGHTITLHLLNAPGRVHRFVRKHGGLLPAQFAGGER